MKKHSSDILKELDSDDELPDTYKDVAILPAYKNDNRFDEVIFPWLNNINLKSESSVLKSNVHEIPQHEEILCRQGVLKGQDLFCLKSLESCACSTTLVWFINFLLHKDLQSHYSYLKSCLVNDLVSFIPFSKNNYKHSMDIVGNGRYEIVIKV